MTPPAALTPGALDEIERLEKEATPERWTVARELDAGRGRCVGCGEMRHIRVSTPAQYSASGTRTITPAQRDADAALIAALRNAAPALIASARELERMRERIATIADEATGPHPVQSVEESLTCIERALFESRRSYEEMYQQREEHRLAARAVLADLAKAREELETSRREHAEAILRGHAARMEVDALIVERDHWRPALDNASADAMRLQRERDKARDDADFTHNENMTIAHRCDELKTQLAALEARAADARMLVTQRVVAECATAKAKRTLAEIRAYAEQMTSGNYDVGTHNAGVTLLRMLDAPAAPAKADDAWMSRALDGPEIRDDAHADAILAEAGIDPVKELAKTMEMVERYELAAQLAEAVALLRQLSSWEDTDDAVDVDTFLAAIDAGRARAT